MKLIGRRIRLDGKHWLPSHIVSEAKGKEGERLLVCATWNKLKRRWDYRVIHREFVEDGIWEFA